MSGTSTTPVPSLAERCALQLEEAIFSGKFAPGSHLDEVDLAEHLKVSRNTLREAFRLLAHQELVEHQPFRGVFVCSVDPSVSHDLYAVRRQLELGALDEIIARISSTTAPALPPRKREIPDPGALQTIHSSVVDAFAAAERNDWDAVGTANNVFHLGIVQLAGNPLATRLMRQVVTKTRLWFLGLGMARDIHEAYLEPNAEIYELMAAGQFTRARVVLELYLLQAEERMVGLLSNVLNKV